MFYIGDMDIGWYSVNINDFIYFSVIFAILVEWKVVIIIETLNKKKFNIFRFINFVIKTLNNFIFLA